MFYKDLHELDRSALGGQLFEALDAAWQSVLAESGDTYDARYADLTDGVGLALVTAPERPVLPAGADNPLAIHENEFRVPVPTLAERGNNRHTGRIGYRYNGRDRGNPIDPSILAVGGLDQIDPRVQAHGRYPINAAAKVFHLLSNPYYESSFDWRRRLDQGTYGQLHAAGGLRFGDGLGIGAVSGGNQLHDHIAINLWWQAARSGQEHQITSLKEADVDVLSLSFTAIMQVAADRLQQVVRDIHNDDEARLDAVPHDDYQTLLFATNDILKNQVPPIRLA